MNSSDQLTHILPGCFTDTAAIITSDTECCLHNVVIPDNSKTPLANGELLSIDPSHKSYNECIRLITHSAPFCNRNEHTCAHFCYKMVHCGTWNWYIMGFVKQVQIVSFQKIVYIWKCCLQNCDHLFCTQCVKQMNSFLILTVRYQKLLLL